MADPLQHIDEVVVGINIVEPAGREQTLHDADVPGTQFGPAEEPVFLAHRDDPQCPLNMVRIYRHVRITQEHLQPLPPVADIAQGLGERTARQEALRREELVDPGEEALDERFGVPLPLLLLGITREVLVPDLGFDLVECPDHLECFGDPFRLDVLRIVKMPS